MTDEEIRRYLKPRHNWLGIVASLVGVAGGAWAASEWMHNRAGADDVKALTNNSFQQRLDMEVFKGEMKSINIRLERIEKAVDAQKSDNENRRRR